MEDSLRRLDEYSSSDEVEEQVKEYLKDSEEMEDF